MFKRTLQLLRAAWLTTGTLWAASDPFVGKWKLDPSQSKESDQMHTVPMLIDFGPGSRQLFTAAHASCE